MRYTGAALLTLAIAAGRMDAQANDDRLRSVFDQPTFESLHALLDSAHAAGLPAEPLIDKALEGAAKHASSDRIIAVVRDLSARLADARSALGGYGTADELSAGTSALRAGIGRKTLAELRHLRHNEQVTIPLAVAAELVARGVRPDSASAQVLRLAASGAPDVELAALPRSATSPPVVSTMSPPTAAPTTFSGTNPNGPVQQAGGSPKRPPPQHP